MENQNKAVSKNDAKTEQKTKKKPRFSFAWKALTVVISLLIIYTAYHVFFGLSERVPTTPAGLVEQNSSVMLEGVIFRKEDPISTYYKGDILPNVANGERVTTDSVVAKVYNVTSDDDKYKRIEELNEQIDVLERSNVKGLVSVVDIEKLNSEIDRLYTSLMLAISNNENYKIAAIEKELTVCLNKMKIYRNEVDNYNDEIAELKNRLAVIYNSFDGLYEEIIADNGGYFYYSCDGYESDFTYEKLFSLTPSSFKEIAEQTKNNPIVESQYRCKFVYENVWYMASSCDDATASLLEVGKEYSITLFDIKERELTVTLEQIGESQNGECVLILSCSNMPEGFDYSRHQTFRLDISSKEGYRVPVEAVQTVVDKATGEEQTGVYILNASVVHFRRIDIIAEGNGYYIVAKLDKTKENYYEYLNLNDLIILEPDGMYEGKILNK